jgi:hypothetical protein
MELAFTFNTIELDSEIILRYMKSDILYSTSDLSQKSGVSLTKTEKALNYLALNKTITIVIQENGEIAYHLQN